VTDQIERSPKRGFRLVSRKRPKADIVTRPPVRNMSVLGDIAFSVDDDRWTSQRR